MTNYNNGHVVDVSKMSINEYEQAAKEWSEGSRALEELLLYCLKNNIITQACCVGHKETDMAFLQFELSERNMKDIIKIIHRYYNLNGVNMTFVNQPGIISKFDIRVPKNIGEQFFKDMLIQLSNGLSVGIDSLPIDMRSTIDAMMEHKVPNDYLEVQYSNDNNQKKLFVATTNPNYSDSYWDKENAKPWVEDSVSIEDTPEIITPILNDIAKKAPIEYGNYIENQRRMGNQKYGTLSSKQDISQFTTTIDNQPTTFVANAQATRENDYARQNSITIVEVLPGMSIEEVAKEICGKRCMCQFNNFKIDGTKYTNPEQIVEAYKKDWNEGKKRHLEAKKDQEQIDASIREQQMVNYQNLSSDEQLNTGGITR